MTRGVFACIDAGRENCPCFLALTDDCLTCGRLSDKKYCDCDWRGVCVYNEFIQNGEKIRNARTDFNAAIVNKKEYGSDLAVLSVAVDKGFAVKASAAGSYVFVKARSGLAFCDVPISVMKSDVENNLLHLAVKAISAKTKPILRAEHELTLRGVYRNGILNVKALTEMSGTESRLLLITKGIGFAPAVLLSDWLGGRAGIDILTDKDKIGNEIILDYLPQSINSAKETDLKRVFESEKERAGLAETIKSKGYGAVVALTSDYYIKKIRALLAETENTPKFACGNNFKLCCGEGLCGACGKTDARGVTFKMCKCDNIEVLGEH